MRRRGHVRPAGARDIGRRFGYNLTLMSSEHLLLAAMAPIAYLLGSVPFGLLVGLSRGVDVRKGGSGNIGATNVGRLLGGRFFALVFTLDLLKGLLPMLTAGLVVYGGSSATYDAATFALWLGVGLGAILGHMFSVFLKFQGGKGVATSAGVILGLYPFFTLPAVVTAIVWLIAFAIWRYVSVASLMAAVAFPIAYAALGHAMGWPITGAQLPLLLFACLVSALVVVRHRNNIARLRKGTEHGFGR